MAPERVFEGHLGSTGRAGWETPHQGGSEDHRKGGYWRLSHRTGGLGR